VAEIVRGSEMSDGRKILDDLRGVLKDGVDEVERAGTRGLDRLAEKGVRELEQLRSDMAAKPRRGRGEARHPFSPSTRSGSDEYDREAGRESRRTSRRESRGTKGADLRARARAKKERKREARKRGSRRQREEAELDPAEREHRRHLRVARKRANQRIAFITHFGSYVATLAIVLVTTRSFRVTTIVALGWGIGIFCHYLGAVAAPKMRDRWLEREVGAQSARGVKTERRQVETRSRRSLEDLSASIAHEIRNPITAAKSLVQQMGEDPASNENIEFAGLALSELDRVERSISHLLRYARDEQPHFQSLSLREITGDAVEGLRDRAESVGVETFVDFDHDGVMRGDPEKLRRVIENLMSNAIDAVSESETESGRIEILGGENLAGSEVWLRIIDNGPGIPLEEQERIWSPFFTTKDSGTGLGLALSRKTIEAHGGRVELLSDARRGTEFILTFPKDPNANSTSVDGA
jgi:signal transduction histidine kinase